MLLNNLICIHCIINGIPYFIITDMYSYNAISNNNENVTFKDCSNLIQLMLKRALGKTVKTEDINICSFYRISNIHANEYLLSMIYLANYFIELNPIIIVEKKFYSLENFNRLFNPNHSNVKNINVHLLRVNCNYAFRAQYAKISQNLKEFVISNNIEVSNSSRRIDNAFIIKGYSLESIALIINKGIKLVTGDKK